MAAAERGLSGLEGFAALPGTIGGAIRANDSARGNEISSAIESISIARGGEVVNLNGDEIAKADLDLILGCVIRFEEANAAEVKSATARYLRLSKTNRPGIHWLGPVFRNVGGRSPSRIITRLGLKGASYGDAAVGQWDSNFLINKNAAKARDLMELIDLVRKQVYKRSGIELELAIEVWQ